MFDAYLGEISDGLASAIADVARIDLPGAEIEAVLRSNFVNVVVGVDPYAAFGRFIVDTLKQSADFLEPVSTSRGNDIEANFHVMDNLTYYSEGQDFWVMPNGGYLDPRGGDDVLITGRSDDTAVLKAGNDRWAAGAGFDMAVFSGARSDYTITRLADGSTRIVDRVAGRDGTDVVYGVERLTFNNGQTRYDILGNPNLAPLVTVADRTVTKSATTTIASIVTATDSNFGDQILKYQFFDATDAVGSGYFDVSGIPQVAKVAIDLSPGQLLGTTFHSGSGADNLYARAYDGSDWSAWKQFRITAPVDCAPVVSAADRNFAKGAVVEAAGLFAATDPDGDTITSYQTFDATASAGSGRFVTRGVANATNIPVTYSPDALAATTFQTGPLMDDLYVRAFDGILWSAWKKFHVAAPNHAPVVTITAPNGTNVGKGAHPAVSTFFTISDFDDDAIVKYQFFDATIDTASGHFVVDGIAQAAKVAIDVSPAQLGGTTFQSGSGSDDLYVRAYDGSDWSVWKPFTVTAPIDRAPLVSTVNLNVSRGANLAATDLFTATDPDGDAITAYQFFDATANAASGHFVVGGVQRPTNVPINVSAAQLATATFQTGVAPDLLYVRAFDGVLWSTWKPFNVSAPNHAPVVTITVPKGTNVGKGAHPAVSTFFTISDFDGDAIVKYQFFDATIDATSGHFVVDGIAEAAKVAINVSPAQLGGTTFQSGSGSDDLYVRAYDGSDWSVWKPFTVTAPLDRAPLVSTVNLNISKGANLPAADLFTATDPDGDAITAYQFFDATANAASGHFVVGGVQRPTNVPINVSAAQLATTTFQTGLAPDLLYVRATDGVLWSAWKPFDVAAPIDRAPLVSTVNLNVSSGANLPAADLFTATDPDGDLLTEYQFRDATAAASSGYFAIDGARQGATVSIDVLASQLAATTFHSGSGTDNLQVRASDGVLWSNWANFTVTAPVAAANAPPLVSGADFSLAHNTGVAIDTHLTASDDHNSITKFEFWDKTSDLTAGHPSSYFTVNGIQPAQSDFEVMASNFSQVNYVGGSTIETDDFAVRAFDGTQWGAWLELHPSIT